MKSIINELANSFDKSNKKIKILVKNDEYMIII